MPLPFSDVIRALKELIPLEYAEEWDNVGLLVAPSEPPEVRRIMLTIDLTRAVCDEAIAREVQLLIAYHPPLFNPIRRLSGEPGSGGDSGGEIVRLIENRIGIYSPHTALDAIPGGVNDWLLDAFGEGERWPVGITQVADAAQTHKVVVFVPADHLDRVRSAMAAAGAGHIGNYSVCSFNLEGFGTFLGSEQANPTVGKRGQLERAPEYRLEMVCSEAQLRGVAQAIRHTHPYEEPAWEIIKLAGKPSLAGGPGRGLALPRPARLSRLVGKVKSHLGLNHVRVAKPVAGAGRGPGGDPQIERVYVCAGAGGSVLGGLGHPGTLLLTGEMRHHDVLAETRRGGCVILCDHTNTERGYLPTLKAKIAKELGRISGSGGRTVSIHVSNKDREPLEIV